MSGVSQVVVVGAGVGGLACALRLRMAGHAVTLLEQSTVVGGKLGRYERDGFRFDTGPSLLTVPRFLADLALPLELVRLDPIVRHVFADGTTLDSTDDPAEFAARIARTIDPRSAREWRRLWRRAERVWTASLDTVLRSPVDGRAGLAKLAWRLPDLLAIAPGRTLHGIARGQLSDPRLRVLLERYATYAGADPRRAPAALMAIPYAELRFGGWYVRGGLSAIADALAERARAVGVSIRTGTRVTAIESAAGAVTGVRTATGERIAAEQVVSNVDALQLYRDLLPDPVRAARLAPRSLAGFVVLLGVRGRTPGLARHTVFFPPDYAAEFAAIFGEPPRPVPDPTVYVSVPDDPAVRPDGHEAWFILVNAPPQGAVDWRAPGLADRYADHVLATLAHRGLDVRDRIVFREVRTPADLEVATATPGGAIYGTPAHSLLRPGNRGPVAGLYLVGGSVHPGGGLPLTLLSAEIVAGLIGPARSPAR